MPGIRCIIYSPSIRNVLTFLLCSGDVSEGWNSLEKSRHDPEAGAWFCRECLLCPELPCPLQGRGVLRVCAQCCPPEVPTCPQCHITALEQQVCVPPARGEPLLGQHSPAVFLWTVFPPVFVRNTLSRLAWHLSPGPSWLLCPVLQQTRLSLLQGEHKRPL